MRGGIGEAVYLSSSLVGVDLIVHIVAGRCVAEHAGAALVQVDGVLASISTGLEALQDGLNRGQVVGSGSVEDDIAFGRVLLNHIGVVEVAKDCLDAY